MRLNQIFITTASHNTFSLGFSDPVTASRTIAVKCDEPAKLVVKAEPRKAKEDDVAYVANPSSGKVRYCTLQGD